MTAAAPMPGRVTLASRLRRVNRITLVAALSIVALIVGASSFTLGLLSLVDTTRLQAKVMAENAGASRNVTFGACDAISTMLSWPACCTTLASSASATACWTKPARSTGSSGMR